MHADSGDLEVGRPVTCRAIGRQLQRAPGKVNDHKVGDGFPVILGVLNSLVDAGSEVPFPAVVTVEDKWKFTHVRALKTERRPREDVELQF